MKKSRIALTLLIGVLTKDIMELLNTMSDQAHYTNMPILLKGWCEEWVRRCTQGASHSAWQVVKAWQIAVIAIISPLGASIRTMGEGGSSHLRLLAPSVHYCVTDGRETRVGVGVSPSQGVRQPGSPRAAPHGGRGPVGNGPGCQVELRKGGKEGPRSRRQGRGWEIENWG